MIRLFFEQTERRIVAMVAPVDAARLEIVRHRLEGAQKFPLLDGECANCEVDRRALLQKQQRVEHGKRILAARQRYGHAIAVADHLELRDRFADLAQQYFF